MHKLPISTSIVLLTLSISFSGCVNKHGVSLKYYSDCDEYYDMQGYYHKECGKDDLFTYKEAAEKIKETKTTLSNKVENLFGDKKLADEPQLNVW